MHEKWIRLRVHEIINANYNENNAEAPITSISSSLHNNIIKEFGRGFREPRELVYCRLKFRHIRNANSKLIKYILHLHRSKPITCTFFNSKCLEFVNVQLVTPFSRLPTGL